jgi:hypothetical protein
MHSLAWRVIRQPLATSPERDTNKVLVDKTPSRCNYGTGWISVESKCAPDTIICEFLNSLTTKSERKQRL